MANDTNIKSKFFGPNANNTQITAASDTNLAAEGKIQQMVQI